MAFEGDGAIHNGLADEKKKEDIHTSVHNGGSLLMALVDVDFDQV